MWQIVASSAWENFFATWSACTDVLLADTDLRDFLWRRSSSFCRWDELSAVLGAEGWTQLVSAWRLRISQLTFLRLTRYPYEPVPAYLQSVPVTDIHNWVLHPSYEYLLPLMSRTRRVMSLHYHYYRMWRPFLDDHLSSRFLNGRIPSDVKRYPVTVDLACQLLWHRLLLLILGRLLSLLRL